MKIIRKVKFTLKELYAGPLYFPMGLHQDGLLCIPTNDSCAPVGPERSCVSVHEELVKDLQSSHNQNLTMTIVAIDLLHLIWKYFPTAIFSTPPSTKNLRLSPKKRIGRGYTIVESWSVMLELFNLRWYTKNGLGKLISLSLTDLGCRTTLPSWGVVSLLTFLPCPIFLHLL